jgi:sugar phosphate isomerase/epimerase
MRLCCSSQSLDRMFQDGRMDLFGFIRYADEGLGLTCVEIEDKHFKDASADYLGKVNAQSERSGIAVANLAFFCSFGFPTKAENEAELRRAFRWMEVGKALGCAQFRIFAGWMGGPDRDIGVKGAPVEKTEAAWSAMVGCVKAACERARTHGLNVVIENHDHGGFLSYSKDVLRLFAEAGAGNLSLLLDTGNFVDGLDGIAKTIHLVKHHVHLKVKEIREDGRDNSYDLDGILLIIRGSRFDGTISIEYEGTQDELTHLPKLVSYVRSTLKV